QKSSDLKSPASTSPDTPVSVVGPFVKPFIGPVAQNGSAGKPSASEMGSPATVPGAGPGPSTGAGSLRSDGSFFPLLPLINQPGVIASGTPSTLGTRTSISFEPASETLTEAFGRQPLDLPASPVEREQNTGPLLLFSGVDADFDSLAPGFIDPVE